MLLPKEMELSQVEHFEIAGLLFPAEEVGGDYYDVLEYNGCVKIGIANVTGHGLESGILVIYYNVQHIGKYVGKTELNLNPGDIVLLYTDGITEALNFEHEQYGLERLFNKIGYYRLKTFGKP
jgi:serine phosphatase RsbU (regulator of sigma subunit)